MASKRHPGKSSPKRRAPAKARKDAQPGASKRVDSDTAVRLYRNSRTTYEVLAEKVAAILEDVLKAEGYEYHSVDYRAKELDSYEKKAEGYDDPATEIHDMAGVRIIAYVESEARLIADRVRDLFDVDPVLSEDKSVSLGVDKVGYRSDHYVATLPAARCKLPEFKKFEGMRFEVQVRTILQHAWAEIEHDRNYKFTGVLPPEIRRRFALLAGSLELLDREFDRIAAEIDEYAGKVVESSSAGQLDISVDTISLRQYLMERFASAVESGALRPTFGRGDEPATRLVYEVERFGVSTLAEFDRLIPDGFEEALLRTYSADDSDNFLGLVREILMIADADKYFTQSWPGSEWKGLGPKSVKCLEDFGVDVDRLAKEYGLTILKGPRKSAR